jgi:hypothetical protein
MNSLRVIRIPPADPFIISVSLSLQALGTTAILKRLTRKYETNCRFRGGSFLPGNCGDWRNEVLWTIDRRRKRDAK